MTTARIGRIRTVPSDSHTISCVTTTRTGDFSSAHHKEHVKLREADKVLPPRRVRQLGESIGSGWFRFRLIGLPLTTKS